MNYYNPNTATPNTSVYLRYFSFLLHFWHFGVSENIIWLEPKANGSFVANDFLPKMNKLRGFDFANACFVNNYGQTQPGPS